MWGEVATNTSRELVTASGAETEAAGRRLSATLAQGDLVLLAGPLGAGKTTFVRGLASGLGVLGEVASPTFQLVRSHPAGAGGLALAHVDLYRLQGSGELEDLGLDEMLQGGVVVVEWGDRLEVAAPGAGTGRVGLDHVDVTHRRIRLEWGPQQWSL